jgi:predicted ATP-dependent endonuclease of OLD family
MRIQFVEVSNFRKLLCSRIGFASDKTVFVGANNSGKTSAMTVLRTFLIPKEQKRFSLNDFTLSHWPALDKSGLEWEAAKERSSPPSRRLRHAPSNFGHLASC